METFQWIVEKEAEEMRIDKLLTTFLPTVSRAQIQERIKNESVLVNDKPVKQNYRVKFQDVITMKEEKEEEIVAEKMPIQIIYEDEHLMVVEKPRGMVVHPAKDHRTGTLVNGLLYYTKTLSTVGGHLRPGIVHRIDKDTSGLIMVAKDNETHRLLSNQLMEKSVKRVYVALVHGEIAHEAGTIDAPIGRNEQDRTRMAVTDYGKEAITHFQVIERFHNYTLVECQLETGRTHQIRVHMTYIGHPIVGDPKYSSIHTNLIRGQALHAKTLGFIHPLSKKYVEFNSQVPTDFQGLLHKIRFPVDK